MDEAELLFTQLLKCDRFSLYENKGFPIGKDQGIAAASVLKRRMHGEPFQYILGKCDFFGLEFKVTPDTLIPRPETEVLVETALRHLKASGKAAKVLDLGTGSGCIAISLARQLENASFTAVDISRNALEVAGENARSNGVDNRISFLQSDLFYLCNTAFDAIVSNPPYIPSDNIERLQPEIRFEPRVALDGGSDGLRIFRRIISEAAHYLVREGKLFLEIGFGQMDEIKNIFSAYSRDFEIIEVVKDYNQIDRVVVAKRKGIYG